MRSPWVITVAVLGLLVNPCWSPTAAVAAPAGGTVVYLADDGPLVIQFAVQIDGDDYTTVWQQYIDELFQQLWVMMNVIPYSWTDAQQWAKVWTLSDGAILRSHQWDASAPDWSSNRDTLSKTAHWSSRMA